MLRYRSHYPAAAIASLFLLAFFLSQHGGVNAENDVSLRESEMDGGGGGEFSENNGEYYCPLNDDGCDWMPGHGNEYCFKIFQHERTLMEAAEICEAMSIAGCPSKLMKVKQIPHVSKAMRMGGDLCLGQYRADCHYGEHGGEAGWFDMENELIEFPVMYTGGNPDAPLDAINEMGMSCLADFVQEEITGSTNKSEPAAFACTSCIIEIPSCPSLCEDCFKPPVPVGCPDGPICDFSDDCSATFDTLDGCLSRIYDIESGSRQVINLICAGNCANVLISITNLEGGNIQLHVKDPSDDTIFLSSGSDEVKTFNTALADDSVLRIFLDGSGGGTPGRVRILAIAADNSVCVGLIDFMGLPVECYNP